MPHRQATATACVIRQIRNLSRESHDLHARETLLRVERRMIEMLEDWMVPGQSDSKPLS
ncbi:hypothetical protein [Azospirillum humicireducens]|uniref:hypothetical protein n=1 Tax=Azospirillum humicireducens TaxID=1226968 RepID=UPI001304A768|nr:hypothetical protein [Azospirillum humicireducens]